MGFKVQGPARVVQMAGNGSDTYYVGQLVSLNTTSNALVTGAITNLEVPVGVADTTGKQVIMGVVVGGNDRIPTYNATWLCNAYGGSYATQAELAARDIAHNKGMYSGSDTQILIDVAVIDPTTLIEGDIFHNAYGTAITEVITTEADTDGMVTARDANTPGWTNVASLGTHYCRKGTNAGLYRTSKNSTATEPSVNVAFPYDVAIGDTFVSVPFKQGLSYIYITSGMYINSYLTPASNHFNVIIEKLNLRDSGKETALFRFCNEHFDNARA